MAQFRGQEHPSHSWRRSTDTKIKYGSVSRTGDNYIVYKQTHVVKSWVDNCIKTTEFIKLLINGHRI